MFARSKFPPHIAFYDTYFEVVGGVHTCTKRNPPAFMTGGSANCSGFIFTTTLKGEERTNRQGTGADAHARLRVIIFPRFCDYQTPAGRGAFHAAGEVLFGNAIVRSLP